MSDDYYARQAARKCDELQKQVRRVEETQQANQRVLVDAFNRMAEAIEGLTREVRDARRPCAAQDRQAEAAHARRRTRLMAFDATDFKLMKSVRDNVREAGETTARKLDEVVASQREILKASQKSLSNDERLLDAFNRMARAVESLAEEVRGLREDLSPPVEKPKLPAPQR